MKLFKIALLALIVFPVSAFAAKQVVNNGETMGQARTKINSNFTELYSGVLVGDCTTMPCLDGTTGSGTYFKLLGTDGTHWSAIQAGNVLANITHRLPLTLPAAGTTRLINVDEYGNWGLVDQTTIGGYSNLTSFVDQTAWRVFYSDGSGDVKELALGADGTYLKSNGASSVPTWATPTGSGASVSDVAYDATSWNAVTDASPSKNAMRDWIESLPSLVISTGLTDNSGTVSVTNPVTTEGFSGSGWNGDTEGLTRNDAYDYLHIADTDDDGLPNKVDVGDGIIKVTSNVLGVATAGVDYEASTPSTKILTTSAAVSAADFLAAKYMSNYGAAGTVAFTLPAVSYNISRAIISEEPNGGSGRAVSVCPPSGEAFATPIGTQTADECISATAAVGSTIIATRYKTGASTWAFRLDPVVGTWTESGGLPIYVDDSMIPSTITMTTSASITEGNLLKSKYLSNYGASGTVNMTLPAISYNMNRTVLTESAQIIKVCPPSGEQVDMSGTLLTADHCVGGSGTTGTKLVLTRVRTGASTWRWSTDVVRGAWTDVNP